MGGAVSRSPPRSALPTAAQLAFAAASLALWLAPGPAGAQTLEYQVKANYLARFPLFVAWPPSAFASPTSPITICVLGADPFGQALGGAVSGQNIGGRALVVRKIGYVDGGCHIVYVGKAPGQSVAEVRGALAATPVLIVTDGANGGDRGHIHFTVERNRVRFHIDNQAAKSAALSISSRLLALALSVT